MLSKVPSLPAHSNMMYHATMLTVPQVASSPSLLSDASVSRIIDSTTTLISALASASLRPSSNTHTSAWSCVSSVIRASQSASSRNSTSEAAVAKFADASARNLAAFAVRNQLAGQTPIVLSKDTATVKSAVRGRATTATFQLINEQRARMMQ